MTGTDTFVVGEELPRIEAVSFHEDFRIAVTWASGSRAGQSDVVDLGPDVFSHKVFAPLRNNPDLFRTVRVINYGSAIAWGESDDLDMSAEGIEELAEQAMSPSDFQAFMERNKFTQEAAAAQLGISRRQVNYFLTSKVIPRTVALACAYINRLMRPVATTNPGLVVGHNQALSSVSLPLGTVVIDTTLRSVTPQIDRALGDLRESLRNATVNFASSGGFEAWKNVSGVINSVQQSVDPDFAFVDLRASKANEPLLIKK